jgi:hypothetical protein
MAEGAKFSKSLAHGQPAYLVDYFRCQLPAFSRVAISKVFSSSKWYVLDFCTFAILNVFFQFSDVTPKKFAFHSVFKAV